MAEQNQEQLNELYLKLQMIDQQIKQVQAQQQQVEQQLTDIAQVKEALGDLESVQNGNEILVPVAGGIFLKATLDDPNTIFLNVGAHVNVKKSLPEVVSLLDEQSAAIEKNYLDLQTTFEDLFHQATTINKQIAPLVTK